MDDFEGGFAPLRARYSSEDLSSPRGAMPEITLSFGAARLAEISLNELVAAILSAIGSGQGAPPILPITTQQAVLRDLCWCQHCAFDAVYAMADAIGKLEKSAPGSDSDHSLSVIQSLESSCESLSCCLEHLKSFADGLPALLEFAVLIGNDEVVREWRKLRTLRTEAARTNLNQAAGLARDCLAAFCALHLERYSERA